MASSVQGVRYIALARLSDGLALASYKPSSCANIAGEVGSLDRETLASALGLLVARWHFLDDVRYLIFLCLRITCTSFWMCIVLYHARQPKIAVGCRGSKAAGFG